MRDCWNSFRDSGDSWREVGRESCLTKKAAGVCFVCRRLSPQPVPSLGTDVGSVRSHCFVLQPAPRSLGKNKIPSLFSSLKKTLTETFPKQQSGPSAQSPRQGSRLFLSLSIFAFFPKKQGWSYGGVGLWHREDGKRNRAAKCRPAESFLLVVSRCVLPTLNTYGNRWVPHMDRDFAPSRRAWRPDDAVSHGWLPCPISSSTFCGVLTPKPLGLCNWTYPTAL